MRPLQSAAVTLLVLGVLVGCGGSSADKDKPVSIEPPEVGACRALTVEDIAGSTDDSTPVDCTAEHTAQTYAVDEFGPAFEDKDPNDQALGAEVYSTCQKKFMKFIGGTESLVLRSVLTWAWFRPSDAAWDKGARWYRCDVVGGGEQSSELVPLPANAKGLLLGLPEDRWLVCVNGETVTGSVKIPCDQPHTWRAVTSIVLGKEGDPYPGDRLVEVRSRDFCSDSVGAWMNYPVDYDYGYTWFHKTEWDAGNRRSICWAKTDQ